MLALLGGMGVYLAMLTAVLLHSRPSTSTPIRSLLQGALYNKSLLTALALLVYAGCVGGLVYCAIHRQPWAGADMSRGLRHLIAPSDKYQYVLEGGIVGGLYTGIAGLCVLLLEWGGRTPETPAPLDAWPPETAAVTSVPSPTNAAAPSNSLPSKGAALLTLTSLLHGFLRLVLLSLLLSLTLTLHRLYTLKNPWYRVSDTLPPPLKHLLSAPVAKSSGILKRCVRLVEIWLFEYPVYSVHTLAVFVETKLRPLLLDYLWNMLYGFVKK